MYQINNAITMDIIVARTMWPVNITIVMSAHGYDTGCPNYRKHTYEFCSGYSLGYITKWNWLTGETTTQQQTQSQAQAAQNMRITAVIIMRDH